MVGGERASEDGVCTTMHAGCLFLLQLVRVYTPASVIRSFVQFSHSAGRYHGSPIDAMVQRSETESKERRVSSLTSSVDP